MLDSSDESQSDMNGLGIIQGEKRINYIDHKVPNIGWYKNSLVAGSFDHTFKILDNDFYFIHSFYCDIEFSNQLSTIKFVLVYPLLQRTILHEFWVFNFILKSLTSLDSLLSNLITLFK